MSVGVELVLSLSLLLTTIIKSYYSFSAFPMLELFLYKKH